MPSGTVLKPNRVVKGDALDVPDELPQPIWSWWSISDRDHDAVHRGDPYEYWLAHQKDLLRLAQRAAEEAVGSVEYCGLW